MIENVKVEELRFGNYINQDVQGYVSVIKIDCFTDLEHVSCSDGWNPEPIILTEEWLMKFGFYSDVINEGDQPIYVLKDKNFYIDFITLQPVDSGFPIALIEIKYVHQLQNLYFALTGEELILSK